MQWLDIICLANSRKHGGRCVAGLRVDGGGWVRPVSDLDDGRLLWMQYTRDDGKEIALLDVVRIPLVGPAAEPFQPENWRLAGERCRLVGQADASVVERVLLPALEPGPALFGNVLDSLAGDGPEPEASLVLIEPAQVRWEIRTGYTGNRQTRASFQLGGVRYDLVVTDPRWEHRLSTREIGVHDRAAAGLAVEDRVLLCVSLGEPLPSNNRRYKLVAGVIVP